MVRSIDNGLARTPAALRGTVGALLKSSAAQQQLQEPLAPRPDGDLPSTTSKSVIPLALRVFDPPSFMDQVKASEAASPEDFPAQCEALLQSAEARLAAQGVACRRVSTTEGFDALAIEPLRTGHYLADPAADLHDVLDGFAFLYSPAKLALHNTRGSNWRYRREVFMAHQAIDEMRLDPITIHEIEHTVLSRCEEKGIPQLFTGSVQAKSGPISTADSEVGGYATYLSFQEISAYSVQCDILANRLRGNQKPAQQTEDITEMQAMAVWGKALCARAEDVAQRCMVAVAATPGCVQFDLLDLTVDPLVGEARSTGPKTLWASLKDLEFSPQVPLPHGMRDYVSVKTDPRAKGRLIDHLQSHFYDLAQACADLKDAFSRLQNEALGGDVHSVIKASDDLRRRTVQHTQSYRNRAEALTPPLT